MPKRKEKPLDLSTLEAPVELTHRRYFRQEGRDDYEAFVAWSAARWEWCAAHGLLKANGSIDWHLYAPLLPR